MDIYSTGIMLCSCVIMFCPVMQRALALHWRATLPAVQQTQLPVPYKCVTC